ncbi:MAG TPA: PQQ-binding-like beta-propeller repeat protein [Solirubrobacterales bacterium]|nr:PQQ-binding-like beta-propeller repeat protein [Solirubrobacterales bacterium]
MSAARRLWREHRIATLALIAAVAVVVAGIAGIAYDALKRPPDIHNEAVTFQPQKPKVQKRKTVGWPLYGYDRARTRYLPAEGIRPPFTKKWRFTEHPLLEFPPTIAGDRLFFVNNSGYAIALDARTGRQIWKRRIGRLNASSPTYYRHRLYIVNLEPGHVVKLDARTGKVLWKHSLPGRAESSPVVVGRSLYFGCEDGNLYSLSTKNGNVRWATGLGGPVKAAPAYFGGVLYVGDYGGYMNAVRAKDGRLLWQSDSLGQGFGTSGAFYSTPAVAFGRVYAGNNDTRVYSFDRHDGTIAWTYSTGGYVYSGPAVARTDRTGPTVYIGSFDGNVYALNARNGVPRWIRSAGGPVIGSLTAVGNIVYAAEFGATSTTGFTMKGGHTVFRYPRGTYTPVVSDGRRLYLIGYSSITALEPVKLKRGLADRIVAR